MDETAIIALVILGGSFLALTVTIFTRGVDAAMKVWAALGPIVVLIATFYFTDKHKQEQIAAIDKKNQEQITSIARAANRISDSVTAARESIASPVDGTRAGPSPRTIPFSQTQNTALELLDSALDQLDHLRAVPPIGAQNSRETEAERAPHPPMRSP